jgi:hypothetical protein
MLSKHLLSVTPVIAQVGHKDCCVALPIVIQAGLVLCRQQQLVIRSSD